MLGTPPRREKHELNTPEKEKKVEKLRPKAERGKELEPVPTWLKQRAGESAEAVQWRHQAVESRRHKQQREEQQPPWKKGKATR